MTRLPVALFVTWASELFDLDVTATPLPGERDDNARLAVAGGASYTLKVHHPDTDAAELDLQDAVLAHCAAAPFGVAVPRLVGAGEVSHGGRARRVRLLGWLDGTVWADAGPPDEARLRALGAAVARLDRALAGFAHPALDRAYRWSMPQAAALRRALPLVDTDVRPFVDNALTRLAELTPALAALRWQAIHNDANEHNILVGRDGDIAGLLDMGDVVRSPRVCGLAVAMAYAQLGHADPVAASLPVLAGYHGEWPVTPDELALLPELVDARLAMSVANAAELRRTDPDNAYLDTSQQPIRQAVARLTGQHRDLRQAQYRDACGYRPVARERAIVIWLQSAGCDPASVVHGATGRTVHSGVELVAPAGSPVRAPLDGVVHAAAPGAVMLEHRTGDGEPFWLSLEPLGETRVTAGQGVARGERIGTVGAAPVHVRLFVVLDLCESDPNLLLRLPMSRATDREWSTAEISRRRRANLAPVLSHSYSDPLHIVAGDGAHLVDASGRRFLDLVNNVAHVGHGHPRVVAALTAQAAVLNTNTRYLYPSIVEYARRLTATFPDPLSVVLFTNSGSEANDLALRLARTATGRDPVLVLDWAYHGNLTSLIELSPYKFNRAGGTGPGSRVRVCELPDPYRGRFGADGPAYAASVAAHCADAAPAAFLHESIPGCAGQVELAPGYLAEAYAIARAAGALCIADEVQCGFGRVGSHLWAFEAHGVVPDIVTLGKPIGNGHPLGAVVTTPQVARAFHTGMEYFNTYGGNPVSCAVGTAVLDVIRDERLMAHAASLGEYFRAGLADLASHHDVVGDVRGRGLFLGVDLVVDRATKEPATLVAARVVEAARQDGVLVSRDGPHDNVLKIKPPLVLTRADVDHALAVLDRALAASLMSGGR